MARIGRRHPARGYVLIKKIGQFAGVGPAGSAAVTATANNASVAIGPSIGLASITVTAGTVVNGASRVERKFRLELVAPEVRMLSVPAREKTASIPAEDRRLVVSVIGE